ncbi:MAG: TetR/AcrR family transcriptional regulator [Myxococcota bacterium]|nr:TetR/AcrR family transcriptional regulator [Myxococcota bacterium]
MDRRVEQSRERAVEAGRALLLEGGIAAVTHLEVARRSGLGRRTVYRHFPDRSSLLYGVLATARFPGASWTGALDADLRTFLHALRVALNRGPLAFVIATLVEASTVDPELATLRARLIDEGCRPLRELLEHARAELPTDLDVDAAQAALEGPLFYRAIVRGEPIPRRVVDDVVAAFMRDPPRRAARARRA